MPRKNTNSKRKTKSRFGSVEILPSGRIRARYEVEYNGRRERLTADRTFTSEADAWKELAGIESDMSRGLWKHPRELKAELDAAAKQAELDAYTVNEFWENDFLPSVAWSPSYRDSETRRYLARIKTYWGEVPIKSIKAADISKWLDSMQTKPRYKRGTRKPKPQPATAATKTKSLELLRRILAEAVDQEILDFNPVTGRKYLARKARTGQRSNRKLEPRSIEEVRTLLAEVPEYSRPVWWLMAFAGLRAEEALPIRMADFDFDACTVSITHTVTGRGRDRTYNDVTKTDAGRRTIALDPRLIVMIRDHCREHGITRRNEFIVKSAMDPANHCMPQSAAQDQARRISDRHGFKPHITPHELRHTAISHALRHANKAGGISVVDVKLYFGHSLKNDITFSYAGTDLDQSRKIAGYLTDLFLGQQDTNVIQFPGSSKTA